MLRTTAILFLIMISSSLPAQNKQLPYEPFYHLDSLAKSNSIAKHFGDLYFIFLSGIEDQVHHIDPKAQVLVRKFEKVFADFYIEACRSWENDSTIGLEEWKEYFKYGNLQPIQYRLLGTNAHLNGGLWQALTHTFTKEDMDQLKKEFVIFKHSLNQTYTIVYNEAVANNWKAGLLDKASLGMTRYLGNWYLYKWRKRQMKLAKYYWTGSPKFKSLEEKVNRKKGKIDLMIVNWLREGRMDKVDTKVKVEVRKKNKKAPETGA